MKVNVRLGEPFWRSVGERNLEIELSPGTVVASLLAQLCRDYPALEKEIEKAPPQIFVEEDLASGDTSLSGEVQVYLVWAVSGG